MNWIFLVKIFETNLRIPQLELYHLSWSDSGPRTHFKLISGVHFTSLPARPCNAPNRTIGVPKLLWLSTKLYASTWLQRYFSGCSGAIRLATWTILLFRYGTTWGYSHPLIRFEGLVLMWLISIPFTKEKWVWIFEKRFFKKLFWVIS